MMDLLTGVVIDYMAAQVRSLNANFCECCLLDVVLFARWHRSSCLLQACSKYSRILIANLSLFQPTVS